MRRAFSSLAALSEKGLDAAAASTVASFLAAPPARQLLDLRALHTAAPDAARLTGSLLRGASASRDALPLLAAVRARCAAFDDGALEAWARDVDAAALAALRPLYSPALTPLRQLTLPRRGDEGTPPGGDSAVNAALMRAAQRGETVHRTSGDDDPSFARKFGERRLVYALSHCAAPQELLAVLYAALLPHVPTSMREVDAHSGARAWRGSDGGVRGGEGSSWSLAELASVPAAAPPPSAAIFYSVGSPASIAKGLRLGTRIIYTLAGEIAATAPSIKTFATLSPIPGFCAWLRDVAAGRGGHAARPLEEALFIAATALDMSGEMHRSAVEGRGRGREAARAEVARALAHASPSATPLVQLIASAAASVADDSTPPPPPPPTPSDPDGGDAFFPFDRLTAQLLGEAVRFYLTRASLATGTHTTPACRVAAFHLGNGAVLARVCGRGDDTAAGLRRSAGFCANYVYAAGDGAAGLAHTMGARAEAYRCAPGAMLAASAPTLEWGAGWRRCV